ncbi:MAG: hypothetical protein KKC19_02730 [Nanoarchaeota archaeon]|nr:hypothetical protein [Nanoarchaeota archaeon]
MVIEEYSKNGVSGFMDERRNVVFYRAIDDHYLIYRPDLHREVCENIAYLWDAQILDGDTPEEEIKQKARSVLEEKVKSG